MKEKTKKLSFQVQRRKEDQRKKIFAKKNFVSDHNSPILTITVL
jgi:hypothetical protein